MGFADRLTRSRTDNLYLVRGKDPTGRRAGYYFRVMPAKKAAFELSIKIGQIQLADYGQVITSGYGEDPPPETKKRMKDEYGFDE
jgi:hypothetical protein